MTHLFTRVSSGSSVSGKPQALGGTQGRKSARDWCNGRNGILIDCIEFIKVIGLTGLRLISLVRLCNDFLCLSQRGVKAKACPGDGCTAEKTRLVSGTDNDGSTHHV